MSDFDQEMISDFVEESKELLESIVEDFLQLEKTPDDTNLVNKLFRAVHTIKGTSGFLGLTSIGTLAHAMETLMSKIRDGKILPENAHINVLLASSDLLSKMIHDVHSSNSVDISSQTALLQTLIDGKSVAAPETSPAVQEVPEPQMTPNTAAEISMPASRQESSDAIDPEILTGFVFEARKYLNNLDELLSSLADHPEKAESSVLQNIFRAVSAIEGTARFIGLKNISMLAGDMAAFFENQLKAGSAVSANEMDSMLTVKDRLESLIDDIEHSDDIDVSDLHQKLQWVAGPAEPVPTTAKNIPAPPSGAPSLQAANPARVALPARPDPNSKPPQKSAMPKAPEKEEIASETIRINVGLIDQLMRLAGELVLIRNQLLITLSEAAGGKREVVQRLDSVTSELQEAIMKTRLQPVGTIFNKIPRIIRDLAQSLGKDIRVQIVGAEVELDKNILELLAGPMIHLVRNSADHGIETPEERTASGKAPQGSLEVQAYHEGGLIHILIRDDGKGIDTDKVAKKAILSGIRNPVEISSMSENEIMNLIMIPGFSTAEQVTDVSGRGVGMDVVKSSIEKLNGSIDITSQPGKGTTFLMKLPLTLAIIPSLIISSQGRRFAIPQVNLDELFSINAQSDGPHIERAGDQEVFRLRDSLLPMVRFNEVLSHPGRFNRNDKHHLIQKYHGGGTREATNTNFAVLIAGNRRFGLIIDEVIGTEEIVVKPMHPAIKKIRIYSGATILGDGSVAMILDAEGIGNHAAIDFNAGLEDTANLLRFAKTGEENMESVLLFRNGPSEQFAVSLHMVQRIQQIHLPDIEKVGSQEFANIDNKSFRILRLESLMNVSAFSNTGNAFLLLFKHVSKPVGLLISELIDIKEARISLDSFGYGTEGILGSDIIEGKLTLFLDIHKLIELSDPIVKQTEIPQRRATDKQSPDSARLLVVEDSSIFRQMLTRYLAPEGYNIDLAEDGLVALEKVRTNTYDLIISDLEMPNMNGLEFIRELRHSNYQNNIPAIALSSINSAEVIEKAMQSGFDHYEVKLEKDNLIKAVKSILLERRGAA